MFTRVFFVSILPILHAKPLGMRDAVVLSRRESVPQGFVKVGPAPDGQTLTFQLGLVQGNIAGLEEQLMSVSTPSSPNYGKFLTKEQVDTYVAPKQDATDAVNAFLAQNGITATKSTSAGDTLSITIPVLKANQLFSTQFDTFKHTVTNTESVRTLQYSIPASLKAHLEYVHPTTVFPQNLSPLPIVTAPLPKNVTFNSPDSSGTIPAFCNSVITPACLQALYNIPTGRAREKSNVLAVAGYIEEYANEADLEQFLESFRPDLPSNTAFTLETLDGGQNPQDRAEAGVEANLDIQYTVGVASGVPVKFISVGETSQDGVFGFMDVANDMLSQQNPPHVFTTSYGSNENELDPTLYKKLCNAYLQLGVRGTSVLYASGDGGVGGFQPTGCTEFVPSFPAGCPYLTAVGATVGVYPEVAASFSSGGFSNVFSRPGYQNAAVSRYLANLGDTYAGLYNATGRAFPDVSAMGENVVIIVDGEAITVGGTSCSSPIFASIISLLNDELISRGRSTLGFLNPLLYTIDAKVLTDITSGNNPGCGTNGFSAGPGWDPVTGLGTPNYDKLRAAFGL